LIAKRNIRQTVV